MSGLAHDVAFAKLSAAAAGALGVDEERDLSTHVAACPLCADELGALQELTAGLRALPTPEPSPLLVARVMRQLELELAARSDERLNLVVVVFLLLFSWTVTVTGFVLFRLLSGEGLSLVGALSGASLNWSLSYFGIAWVGGAAAVVALSVYARKRRVA